MSDVRPSGRPPAVNLEHTYLAVFDDRLTNTLHTMFIADQQYVPNVGVLDVRIGFGYVAGQVSQSTGMPSGSGTYVRSVRLP